MRDDGVVAAADLVLFLLQFLLRLLCPRCNFCMKVAVVVAVAVATVIKKNSNTAAATTATATFTANVKHTFGEPSKLA